MMRRSPAYTRDLIPEDDYPFSFHEDARTLKWIAAALCISFALWWVVGAAWLIFSFISWLGL